MFRLGEGISRGVIGERRRRRKTVPTILSFIHTQELFCCFAIGIANSYRGSEWAIASCCAWELYGGATSLSTSRSAEHALACRKRFEELPETAINFQQISTMLLNNFYFLFWGVVLPVVSYSNGSIIQWYIPCGVVHWPPGFIPLPVASIAIWQNFLIHLGTPGRSTRGRGYAIHQHFRLFSFPKPSHLVVASLPFLASSLIRPFSSGHNVSLYPIRQDVILAAHLIRSADRGDASSWSRRKPGTCTTT